MRNTLDHSPINTFNGVDVEQPYASFAPDSQPQQGPTQVFECVDIENPYANLSQVDTRKGVLGFFQFARKGEL